MSEYIEPERLLKQAEKLSHLIEKSCDNPVKFVRTETLSKYEHILDMLDRSCTLLRTACGLPDGKSQCQGTLTRSKEIMLKLRSAFSELISNTSGTCGADLAYQLYTWFTERFRQDNRNPNFFYNSDKLPQYIDKFIIAYSYYLHKEKLPNFYLSMKDWYRELDSNTYPLPQFIAHIHEECTIPPPEAVVLERVVKKSLYSSQLFSEYRETIYNGYRQEWHETYEDAEQRSLVKY